VLGFLQPEHQPRDQNRRVVGVADRIVVDDPLALGGKPVVEHGAIEVEGPIDHVEAGKAAIDLLAQALGGDVHALGERGLAADCRDRARPAYHQLCVQLAFG
jgi:hypothetical protein